MKKLQSSMLAFCAALAALSACSGGQQQTANISGLDPAAFDTVIGQKPVKLYFLTNHNGMEAAITNFGGRLVSLMVPDRDGKPTDVVLGYDNIAQYADTVNSPSDFGSSVGRYANRINKGQFKIGDKTYDLPKNNFGHCLHGGPSGWQYQVYDAKQTNDSTLLLHLTSPDGDNGFPGKVDVMVVYTLMSDGTLDINFGATTDKPTVINMTNHSYFCLTGDPSQPAEDMILSIDADNYTPSDSTYMTTGEILPVEGTPMDFRKPRALSEGINDNTFGQIRNATGYDHNWCLNTYRDGKGDDTKVCATLYSERTGIKLEMFTDEPGVQVYTANFQGTGISCKRGVKYPKHVSVCLESQKYPDTPNKPQWPTAQLNPGEKYHSHLAYRFSTVAKQ